MALRALLGSEGLSRTALAEQLGVSQMAMSRIVKDLIESGLVEESGAVEREGGPGRRQTQLRICDVGTYAAGISLSAYSYSTEVCIVNAAGDIVSHRFVPLEDLSNGEKAVATLAEALNVLIGDLGLPRDRIVGAGVAVGANLDFDKINVVSANYLAWKPFNIVETVAKITGLSVHAENIVGALTLAEASLGIAKDQMDVVTVRVATSIGACILQHGQVIRGHGDRPGRVGHYHTGASELTCSCGRNDCLNCFASGWSVLARLGKIDEAIYDADQVVKYARLIDGLSSSLNDDGVEPGDLSRALESAGSSLSGALQIINQTVDPQSIILAGSMSRLEPYVAGLKLALESSHEGKAVLKKLAISKIRAYQAAAIMVLLEKIYSPALDFDALRQSAGVEFNNEADSVREAG